MSHNDRYFDGLAEKFAGNIYGTTKGRLRHILLCEAITPWLPAAPGNIIELGGGTGVMAHYLAGLGHHVTMYDASADVLKAAHSLAAETPGMDVREGRLQDVNTISDYDMIICHAVLEWLSAPYAAIEHIVGQMRAGTRLSLSFFNRDAALFSNALYGNFDYIRRGMYVKNQVRLNPHSPLPVNEVLNACEKASLTVLSRTGIRCFHDYLKDRSMQEACFDEILALEREYNQKEPYLWLGRYFHLILEKR